MSSKQRDYQIGDADTRNDGGIMTIEKRSVKIFDDRPSDPKQAMTTLCMCPTAIFATQFTCQACVGFQCCV
jgi:hypothetical protein